MIQSQSMKRSIESINLPINQSFAMNYQKDICREISNNPRANARADPFIIVV